MTNELIERSLDNRLTAERLKVLASVRNKTHLLPDGSYNNLVSVEEFSGFTTIEATDTQGNRLDVAIKE